MTLILHRDGQKERVDSVFTPKRVLWVKIVGVFDIPLQNMAQSHTYESDISIKKDKKNYTL